MFQLSSNAVRRYLLYGIENWSWEIVQTAISESQYPCSSGMQKRSDKNLALKEAILAGFNGKAR